MRKIKFRVFDPSTNSYIKDTSDFWVNPANFSTYMEYRKDLDGKTIFENTNFIYEQFTGFYDHDEVEIFEGDIVGVYEYDSKMTNLLYRAEVVYDDEDPHFVIKEIGDKKNSLIFGTSYFADVYVGYTKVLGNIHESKS